MSKKSVPKKESKAGEVPPPLIPPDNFQAAGDLSKVAVYNGLNSKPPQADVNQQIV